MHVKKLKEGILEVLFPKVCIICGIKLPSTENFVCNSCLNDKFDEAFHGDKKSSNELLLPEGVYLQHALWNFDKGGHLQNLLHELKYHRLTGVGVDIGRQLGKSLLKNPFFINRISGEKAHLLPVPLHARKQRIRGYNQAFYIAKGVSDVTKLHILKPSIVKRTRNTQSQTGFSLEKRRKNMEGAFSVEIPEKVNNAICIIIDDVFTTGATTFELSARLIESGCKEVMIATIAQA